ncbi:MAG: type I-E CRISPR-associated protein Cas7/Cse4/CasC [Panacagrimonas sp.]
MTQFIQLHLLTSYPPANLNRDDLGRPKSAIVGGASRLRVSSQSLKRAWRTSDVFHAHVGQRTGIRSKELGIHLKAALLSGVPFAELLYGKAVATVSDGRISEKDAAEWTLQIASVFVDKKAAKVGSGSDEEGEPPEGEKKSKKDKKKSNVNRDTLKSEQLVFYSVPEIASLGSLIDEMRRAGKGPSAAQLASILSDSAPDTPDLAMFGRMLANAANFNIEAAVQVAHAFTVHKVQIEDDYFTAVDDLNKGEEDLGAGHLGETGFGAGVFYLYICINRDLLQENLQGDAALTVKTLHALLECAATVAPTGKQNSFASRAHALYCLAEKGPQQPRSLSLAFTRPIQDGDVQSRAITELDRLVANMDQVYGPRCEGRKSFNVLTGTGSLRELQDFITE